MANDKRPTTIDDFITIAKVVKTQGRVGEVAAEIFTDFPERFGERKQLFALAENGTRQELTVEESWPHKGRIVFKFAGIDSISDAEALLGSEIQIRKSDRAPLEVGEVWISDLIGVRLSDRGEVIGIVKDVRFGYGEAPMLIIERAKQEVLVPYASEYIVSQDLQAKRLDMKLPEGLLDVDAPLTKEEKERQKP